MLRVVGSMLSPWARRVAVVLEEKGVEYEHENFFPFGELTEEFKSKSPLGLIPVLDTEEGSIADSTAICLYLEARFPEVPLLPSEPFALGRATWFSAFAEALFRHEGTIFFQRAVRGHLMQRGARHGRGGGRSKADTAASRLFGRRTVWEGHLVWRRGEPG